MLGGMIRLRFNKHSRPNKLYYLLSSIQQCMIVDIYMVLFGA